MIPIPTYYTLWKLAKVKTYKIYILFKFVKRLVLNVQFFFKRLIKIKNCNEF